MIASVTIVWFRQDLRLNDNPALAEASARGLPVIPVFIWSPAEEGAWPPGAASRWWLHHSLTELRKRLAAGGATLVIRRGPAREALRRLVVETGAGRVVWNRRYEPFARERDQGIKTALREDGLTVESFNSALLNEPWTIQNRAGKPFQVFTPYWRTCLAAGARRPVLPAPQSLPPPDRAIPTLEIEDLELLPKINWAAGWEARWAPGEAGAREALVRFAREPLTTYETDRNRLDLPGTSGLSPHLHFGEISPGQVIEALAKTAERQGLESASWQKSQFVAELGWREFAYHLLYHFPHTPEQPLRPEFSQFPWRADTNRLQAWQRGRTGIPLVDAGIRQLWTTGWMHNRARMITGSLLVKNLLLPWQEGARWFWDTLVDADLACNTLGWQWVAGCGADAAPFFRIFNPVSQGSKCDPNGDYVRRWVPELRGLGGKWIQQPWAGPPEDLNAARVRLGVSYPEPIISLYASRETALAAYQRMRGRTAKTGV